ncbi:MAG: class I SAM-dependent methyltransferase [Acidobacteriota bacterium]|nr:class I SAM-dependent methyltransferase [Acidobacteriota bacterium]
MSDPEQDVSADHRRRLSFGSVAAQYDRLRPGYPAVMVDDVLAYAHAQPGDPVLDVGAGTGRATLLFAERGYVLTAIEPDRAMAAVASRRAATAGLRLEMLNTDFEQASLPSQGFQLLISATAWHWVTPGLRNALAARALKPGGALAPFWNRPMWRENPLRPELDRIYAELEHECGARPRGPMNPFGAPLEIVDDREWLDDEFRDNADFTDLDARVYGWRRRYSAGEYVALLGTHSDHITLPEGARERLFAAVAGAIDAAGGSFELGYQTLLCLARRRAG